MSWCLADVQEIHGSADLVEDRDTSAWHGEGEVIYPDVNPRGSKAGEYVPKEVFPEELRLTPPIQQAPAQAPSKDDRILPPPNLWNSPGHDEAPGTSPPAGDSVPRLERGQTSSGVEQTYWAPVGPVERGRSSHFADALLPAEFSLPLSSASRADYRQSASPPRSEPSEGRPKNNLPLPWRERAEVRGNRHDKSASHSSVAPEYGTECPPRRFSYE